MVSMDTVASCNKIAFYVEDELAHPHNNKRKNQS